ncbi:predicted nucleic acid-binding protein [Pelotomaculum thermopropionicum SI]|uniref:Ribonuclease VapC n=1 Tax=Pelotomaculum thermopropionicum (strain DSM 13744 / JCM 10971 / SI) TaxID=370438 RepID=A5D5A3_PELTS|nr:predicted nucleic acid-binding protein [Pelotomaculum thermopropionicum SI]
MNNLLLDTSVLVDHLREYKPATEFLETAFNSGAVVAISAVTEMELYAGKSMENPAIEEDVLKFLKLFKTLPVTSNIARQAGLMLRRYRHQGLTPIDAIIASTAMEHNANLITRNIKHFRMVKGIIVFGVPDETNSRPAKGEKKKE